MPYSTTFAQLPIGVKKRLVMANVTTVIPIEKGVDATHSRQFAAVQLPQYTSEKCGALLSLKLIGLPVACHFCIQVLLLSVRYLVKGMTHNSEAYVTNRNSL